MTLSKIFGKLFEKKNMILKFWNIIEVKHSRITKTDNHITDVGSSLERT